MAMAHGSPLLDGDMIAHIASFCHALELSRLPRVNSVIAASVKRQADVLWLRLLQKLQLHVDEPRMLLRDFESKPPRLSSWRVGHEALTKLLLRLEHARAIEQTTGHPFLGSCILAGADEHQVTWLLDVGADANDGQSQAPALYLLAGLTCVEPKTEGWEQAHRMVPLLVEAGADVNQVVLARSPPFTEADASPPETALFSACSNGASREMIEALLVAGADARWSCPRGWSALHMCVQEDEFECAEELLYKSLKIQGKARRADPNRPDNQDGRSPFEMALLREKKAARHWYSHCDSCHACQHSVDTRSKINCSHPITTKWCDALQMLDLLRNYGGFSYDE